VGLRSTPSCAFPRHSGGTTWDRLHTTAGMQEVERSRSQSRDLLDQSCPGGAGDSFNNKQTLPVFSYPVQSLPGDWSIKIPAYPRGTILQTILLSQHGFKAVISFWQASDNHWPKIFSYLLFLEQDSVAIVAIRIASLNPFHGTSIWTIRIFFRALLLMC